MGLLSFFRKPKKDEKATPPAGTNAGAAPGQAAEVAVKQKAEAILKEWKAFQNNDEPTNRLRALGPSVIPALISLLEDSGNYSAASAALVALGDHAAVEPLFHSLSRFMGGNNRAWAVKALIHLVDPSDASWLIDHLRQKEGNWQEAARPLGYLAGNMQDSPLKEQIVTTLLSAYRERDASSLVGLALAETKDPRAVDPVLEVLRANSPSEDLVIALGAFKDERVVEALIALLDDVRTKGSYTRTRCVESLGKTGNPRAVEALLEIVEAPGYNGQRNDAIRALGKLGDTRAVPALIHMLSYEGDSSVRSLAADALGLLRDERAIEALKASQTDADRRVREAATEALALLGVYDAAPAVKTRPEIVGVLILSHHEVANQSSLLWEITLQQGKLGFQNSTSRRLKEVFVAAGDAFNDGDYVYASLRSNFNETEIGDLDLMSRAYSYEFRTEDGSNYGKYFVIMDKPR